MTTVSVIGSGNWGSCVARLIGQNAARLSQFDNEVFMYVYPEQFEGKDLGETINSTHENPKYLPGVKLPPNVIASASMEQCVKNRDILIFVFPHQFIPNICKSVKEFVSTKALGVSFIKGVAINKDGIGLASEKINSILGIPVSVVSGANIANEVAREKFAEATLAYDDSKVSSANAEILRQLFHRPYFKIDLCPGSVAGAELQGALKNVVALAAGFVDGLDLGSNTKAAILRLGMIEMHKIIHKFYPDVKNSVFWESCGVADVITTCYSGRNRKCAEEFIRTGDSWEEIEKRMLNGQKLQGTLTCKEVEELFQEKSLQNEFPFFHQVYEISFKGAPGTSIVDRYKSENGVTPGSGS